MSRPDMSAYAVQVRGQLDDHWSDWLGGFTITRNTDGTSTLTGTADQAQLHGVLAGLRDVGVELLHLQVTEPTATRPATAPAPSTPLHTDRLILRPATADDVDATWVYRRLDAVNQWLTGRPDTLDEYRDLFSEPERLATTVMVELHDGTVIGDLMLRRHDAWAQTDVTEQASGQQIELGWVLDPAHTSHGYATEAVHELLRHSFEDLGVHRVTADCFLANEPSWRLMERLGMRREAHTRRDALHRSGHWLDSLSYAVLDEEWPTRQHSGSQQTPAPATQHCPSQETS